MATRKRPSRPQGSRRSRLARPCLDHLEDRLAPALYTAAPGMDTLRADRAQAEQRFEPAPT